MGVETTLLRWAAVLLLLVCVPAWSGVCRVTTTGSKFNDGSSWVVPADLQQALSAPAICTEIWVAKGIYKPTTGSDRTVSFVVGSSVGVYGGFAGNETDRAQANPTANLTILSGDIDNNDSVDAQGRDIDTTHIVGGNSKHVVTMVTVYDTVLDGFTITGGDAKTTYFQQGGGLDCEPGNSICSPTLSRLVFMGNRAVSGGGAYLGSLPIGIQPDPSVPTLSEVTFQGNQATDGGAIYVSPASNPTITDSTFRANAADSLGGAIFFGALVGKVAILSSMDRVSFVGNSGKNGGAVFCYASQWTISLSFTNVTFFGNHSTYGTVYGNTYEGGGQIDLQFNSVTFNDNLADGEGGAIVLLGVFGNAVLKNSIVWGDRAPLGTQEYDFQDGAGVITDHSIVKGSGGSGAWNSAFGNDGGGNLDVDPRLVAGYQLGGPQSVSPAAGSPAIDAADDASCPVDDQRGVVRKQGAHCDMGAVEAFTVDLIGHKSFSSCATGATSPAGFLDPIRQQIDGAITCAAPIANGSFIACYTNACGGVAGCPLTTHVGTFSGSFGDGTFAATGSIDNITMPVYITPLNLTCEYQVTNISARFAPEFLFTDDGNFGDYAALLNRFTMTPSGYSVISVGDPMCQNFAGSIGSAVVSLAALEAQATLAMNIREVTQGRSVCPPGP